MNSLQNQNVCTLNYRLGKIICFGNLLGCPLLTVFSHTDFQVDKLMNKLLNDQYRLKKASIERSSSEQQVERILYHGTSETSVKEICIHGFNRSFCGKNGIMLLSMLELAEPSITVSIAHTLGFNQELSNHPNA